MKKIILIVSSFLLGVSLIPNSIKTSIYHNVQKQNDGSPFEASYKIGTLLDIPQHKISLQGKTYDTESLVYYPSGKAYVEKSIVLDEFGIYGIEYRASKDNGEIISERFEFETYSDLYTISGNAKARYGLDESTYQTGITGLNLELSRESVFKYNEIINLNSLGTSPFVDLFVLPTKGSGSRDLIRLVFKLEDIHNPDNYLLIRAQSAESDGGSDPWWANVTYIEAGGNNQNPAGVEWGPPMQIHTGGKFGHPSPFSMYGYRNFTNSVGQESLSLRLDLDENRLYGPNEFNENYIVDFDDKRFFSEAWNGFSTNEVYLSIWGENFINDSCPLMITRIGKSDLSQEYLRDRKGPEISLNTKGYSLDNLPKGIVGRKYPVFDASIRDDCSSTLEYTSKVFYNYVSSTRYELPIVDNCFIPKLSGTYTIEYTSKDYYRNESKLIYEVEVVEEGVPFEISLDDSTKKESLVGLDYEVLDPVYIGNIGNVSISKQVKFNNIIIELADDRFIPQEIGKYTITLVVEDLCENKEISYELDVKENKIPVFIKQSFVPKYVIEGGVYEFSPSIAKDYVKGELIESKILIKDKNHNFEEYSKPLSIEGLNDNVTIKFVAESSNGRAEEIFYIPVIDCGDLSNPNIANYVYSSNINKSLTNKGIRLVNQTLQDDEFEFINPLNNKTISMNFLIEGQSDSFVFNLKDSYELDKYFSLRFVRDYTNSYIYDLYIDDVKTNLKADSRIENSLSIDFVKSNISLNSSSGSINKISYSSTGIYLSGLIEGGNDSFAITLVSINTQKLTKDAKSCSPTLVFDNEYRNKANINSTIKVISPKVFDVFSPHPSINVSITHRGSAINSVDGRKIFNLTDFNNLEFLINEYGDYSIIYSVDNGHGGSFRRTFVIKAIDNIKPTITLGGENDGYGKVNVPYAFYKASAKDDLSAQVQLYYYVQAPNGYINNIYEMMIDEHDYSFTILPNKEGIWKVIYLAVDEAGNFASIETTFKVEA